MQGVHLLGIVLTVFVLLWMATIFRSGEGFNNPKFAEFKEYIDSNAEKYNPFNLALITQNKVGRINDSQGSFGTLDATVDSRGKVGAEIDNPYPLQNKNTGILAMAEKCEVIKSVDCDVFDNKEFSKNCGMCLDIGKNSRNVATPGGLAFLEEDKKYAQSKRKGVLLPPYEPTVGSCPAGMFVSNKKECRRLKNQLECSRGSTFNNPTGCSQCYNDSSYSVVYPNDPESPNPSLITGFGTLKLYGNGTLRYKQASNSGFTTVRLSPRKPVSVVLAGPEFDNTVILNVVADVAAEPYSSDVLYVPGNKVIHNGGIYTMVEGVGIPGFSPDRPGDRLWTHPPTRLEDYVQPSEAYIMGYLTGTTGVGTFNNDLYQLVLNDAKTGRKPRTAGSVNVDGFDAIKMAAGYGQREMILTIRPVFTFINPDSEESSTCPSSPFITNPASSTFLESDPCYAKGSGPGKYKLECLQNTFITNGCLNEGKGYPTNSATSQNLLYGNVPGIIEGGTSPLRLIDISKRIYEMAVTSSTGVDANGVQLPIEKWSKVSEFCTGRTISTPCDTGNRDSGPLTKDCIVYLWNNQGTDSHVGSTYKTLSTARSLFGTGNKPRFCNASGTLSPITADAKENPTSIKFWQTRGGVEKVRREMTDIHTKANDQTPTDTPEKKTAILQCYGVDVKPPVAEFKSTWRSARPGEAEGWVDSGGNETPVVLGVNSGDAIYYGNQNIKSSPNWRQVPGGLIWASYSNSQIYGVNRANNIYYNPDYTSGNWRQIPGSLKQVSFDGVKMIVMGVNMNDNIYYANKNITTSPNWTQLPGSLSNLSYSNNQIFGVNRNDEIYYNPDYTSGRWVRIPGALVQVSFDGHNMIVMGVNRAGNIYYANQNITTNPNWTQIPGSLINLTYSNKQIYGANVNNNIYYNSDYRSGNWVQIPGSLRQVSFYGGSSVPPAPPPQPIIQPPPVIRIPSRTGPGWNI